MTISNPAKLLRAYIKATGVTDTKTLAADLDISVRTIQRLKLEVASAMDGASHATANGAISGASICNTSANSAISGVSEAPNAPDMALLHATRSAEKPPSVVIPTRATFESLRDESIQEVKQEPPVGPPKPIAEPKVLRSRGSRLSNDWQLPDDWKAWTRTNFPTSTEAAVTEEADKFRDYWTAKAGQGASKLDWQATWRNWCRTAFAPGKRRDGQPINHGRSAYDEQRAGTEHWLEEKRRRMDEVARICKIGKYRETPVESVQ